MILSERRSGAKTSAKEASHSVMVQIENLDNHHGRASKRGARILESPTDYAYGERQYTVEDLAGHIWTFLQSIKDIAPEEWGGTSVDP